MSYSAIGYTSSPCSSDSNCLSDEFCCQGYCREGIDIDEYCGEVVCPVGYERVQGECIKVSAPPPPPPSTTGGETTKTVTKAGLPVSTPSEMPFLLLVTLGVGTWGVITLLKS